ncbi:hypothetical protein [Actinokineospora sp. NBRC 105648]|uniref:hypothetical protein n=1 Tax=Actinokineospora sp. NBRC 105648 TaxID=3032206 RepID=UPI0024A4AA4E|nr:hypothetical protein [Actinokineospora sp. NBRC 105648]GLZ40617.1 hypothetical protein Acsp05_42410 [Actinokineospora sp. NBRC 105648]
MIVIDPAGMSAAVPVLERYLDAAQRGHGSVAAVALPAGLPPDVRTMVEAALDDAMSTLGGVVRSVGHLPAELRRRIQQAQRADTPWTTAVDLFAGAAGLFGASFKAGAHPRFPSAPPKFLGQLARGIDHGSTGVSALVTALDNLANPDLSGSQKIARTAASVGGGLLVTVGARAATGAMLGAEFGPPGIIAGGVASVGWSVFDSQFHVSDAVGDAAAPVLDKAKDVADDVIGGAHQVIGKLVKPW